MVLSAARKTRNLLHINRHMSNVNRKSGNSCHTAIGFRKAVEADCEFCYLVRELAFREYAERVRGWDEEHEKAVHQTRFASQDFKVIQSEGHDVGILSAEKTSEACGFPSFSFFRSIKAGARGVVSWSI